MVIVERILNSAFRILNYTLRMKTTLFLFGTVALISITAFAQAPRPAPANVKDIVDLEMLTHTEVYDKIHNQGMTSVIFVTGPMQDEQKDFLPVLKNDGPQSPAGIPVLQVKTVVAVVPLG